ncbi:MAG: cytochrome c family protein [Desulfobulbaceae bacterium]|nr:cytochrome c family protein [Desulfobulbaceae bacterium]HIJ90396.1 cytochrome c3 family protein [Deltaproteobacteria bacterium]
MKKTMIALAMMCAAGLSITLTDLNAAPAAAKEKITAPTQELVINGKKPAHFSHAKHTNLGLDCATCHHDAKHQPLNEAAIAALPNADGLRCATCHTEKFANVKLQKRMDVFHTRCKTCHTDGVKGKKGPTNCTACHTVAAATTDQKPDPAPVAAPAPAKKKTKAIEGC